MCTVIKNTGKGKRELKACLTCKEKHMMGARQTVCSTTCRRIRNNVLQKEYQDRKRNQTEFEKENHTWRPLTLITERLICIYTHRGGERNSVKQLADDFSRPAEQVQNILDSAVSSGRYTAYVRWSDGYESNLIESKRYIRYA